MSMTNVRSYLRYHAKSLGLTEWKDGFNSENIPDAMIDRAFWLDMSDVVTGVSRNQNDQVLNVPQSIKVFRKGHALPAEAIDAIVLLSENLIKAVVLPENALTQGNGIVNVLFDTCRYEPLSTTNDNVAVATLTFNFQVILNT